MKHLFRFFAKITGFLSAIIYFKCKVYYQNKANQSRSIKGKAIIMANHKSPLDFVLMMLLFPFRYLRCFVGETLYERHWTLKFFLKNLGAIKVDRLSFDMSFIGEAIDILDKGGVVEIYPEGKLPDGDCLLPFKPSIVYIALASNAPIIPIYHTGNYGLFKRERVIIGEKIYLSDYTTNPNPTQEEVAILTNILQEAILALKELYERVTHEKTT